METGVITAGPTALAPSPELRGKILEFERILISHPGAQFGNTDLCPLKHSFAEGLYIREMFIPKGTLLTGRIHRHEHPIIILQGDLSIVEESLGSRRIRAPYYGISPAGTKRIGYAHEDTVLLTIHEVGEERDIDKIEEMIGTWTYEDYEKGCGCLQENNG